MKKTTLFVLAMSGIIAMAPAVKAGNLVLDATKDDRILCHEGEMDCNSGQSSRLQMVGITREAPEFGLVDFDHAAIKSYLEANKDKKVTATLTLVLRETSLKAGGIKLEVGVFDSTMDWTEGSGNQDKAKAGELCDLYAKAPDKLWTTAKGEVVNSFLNLVVKDEVPVMMVNSKAVEITKASVGTTLQFVLDDALLKHLANDVNCRGFVLFTADKTNKASVFSREQHGKEPKLVLKAE